MIKMMFVCHGNICRSPMAEFVMKDLLAKRGLADAVYVASSATSREEIGNGVHPGTRRKLKEYDIQVDGKYAVQLTQKDYNQYDYFLGMDGANIANMRRILGDDPKKKVYRLLDFSKKPRDIADPWYTENFDLTYEDIYEGCTAFLAFLLSRGENKHLT